jgi:hypothetical protein
LFGQVHFMGSVCTLFVHVVGIYSARLAASAIGQSWSEAGTLHRSLGWTTFGLVLFLVLFGGCRPVGQTGLVAAICFHSLVGFAAYAMNCEFP